MISCTRSYKRQFAAEPAVEGQYLPLPSVLKGLMGLMRVWGSVTCA